MSKKKDINKMSKADSIFKKALGNKTEKNKTKVAPLIIEDMCKNNYIEYDQIRGSNRKERNVAINDWNGFDFVSYINQCYYEKTNLYLDLNTIGCAKEVLIIKDLLLEKIGAINNTILKLYIDFFMDKYLTYLIKNRRQFFFLQLKNTKPIRQFSQLVKDKNIVSIEKSKSIDKDQCLLDNMESSLYLGEDKLVLSFGIMLSLNWLIVNKSYSRKEAFTAIVSALEKIIKQNKLKECIAVTESYNDYPNHMPYKANITIAEKLSEILDCDIAFNITFSDNSKFKFLEVQ